MKRFNERKAGKIILFVIAALLLFGLVVMGLWNAILPKVANVSPINFWQALGILLLSKILFGGFGGRWHRGRQHWKQQVEQKLANMTPEEREKFKQEWQKRCGWRGRYTEGQASPSSPNQSSTSNE